jgi:hypothetical protein
MTTLEPAPGASQVKAGTSEHRLFRAARSRIVNLIGLVVIAVTAPVWLPFVLIVGAANLLRASALYIIVWAWWLGFDRRRVLFVYSDSPNWKQHVEESILPRLPANAVVLNWSQRRQWPRRRLPVLLFRTFAGNREFNPIALVFERFALVERFRFWQPFRDAKHGNTGSLRALETSLFERLEE